MFKEANGQLPLFKHMQKDPSYFSQATGQSTLLKDSNLQAITNYLQSAHLFIIHLFLTVYFTSGMPPRGTELLATLVHNDDRLRDLFVVGEEMVVQSAYLKTNNLTGQLGRVIRVLEPQVAQMILVYLKDVVPVIFLLTKTYYPRLFQKGQGNRTHHPLFTHLFATGAGFLEPTDIYQAIKLETMKHFGFPLGISDWRHIIKGIGRKLIPSLTLSNTFLERQSNHSVSVGRGYYALPSFLPLGAREEECSQFMHISKYWQWLWEFRTKEQLPLSQESRIAIEVVKRLPDVQISEPNLVSRRADLPPWFKQQRVPLPKDTYELLDLNG